MKIGKKLMLMIVTLNLIGTGILMGVVMRISHKELNQLITNEITNLAGKKAEEVQIWLAQYLDTTRTAAQFMAQYQEIEVSRRRDLFNMLVRTVAQENPEITGAGCGWEPNALDGLDARYVNTPESDASGRFIPYWTRTNQGLIMEPLRDYDVPGKGDYYQIAKNTGNETLIDPYRYEFEGQQRLITSITTPIKNKGRFVGAVIVDIDISVIQEQVQRIQPYEGSVAAVFSHGGTVVGHYDPSRIGNSMLRTEADTAGGKLPELIAAVQSGREYTFINTISGKGEMEFFCVPFTVGNTVTPWTLMVGIPTRFVYGPVYRILFMCGIIGVVMLLAITAGGFIMARSISKPLARMVGILKDVGEGDLTQRLDIKTNDEIGTMTESFNGTIRNIRNLVQLIKQKAFSLSNIGDDLSLNMTQTASAVNEITSNIQSIKGQANRQSAGVNESSVAMDKIIININDLNTEIDKQAASVSESSSAIEEMLANIQAVTQTLINNTGNVKNLAEASEVGRSGLQEVATDIREIARESEGLMEINGVIENIASQTNLLSMNAAIEAAHAGEAGKGFAVVADEIRKLAESSGEQSKTISMVLKKIKDSIDKITRSTGEVLEKFEAIDGGVRIVSQQEELIRSAMEEQGEGSKQILEAVGRMNEISSQVKNGSEEMRTGSGAVLDASKTLEVITEELVSGMNEMAVGADQINVAVTRVNEISGQNKSDIDALIREVDKFKIN
jgi:methyl-accepting chemotaxis protein